METNPDPVALRTPEAEKAAAMERYCAALGVLPEYFTGKRVVDLGSGVDAWFARALAEREEAAVVWAVDTTWMRAPDGLDEERQWGAVTRELGSCALARDFLLDDLELGSGVDSIVSVDALSSALAGVEDDWLAEVQAATRGLLAKLSVGGELRVGPLVRQIDEPGGGESYAQAHAILATLGGEGFEVSFEPSGEGAEKHVSFERAIVRRVA